jgi:hypothetical protein
MLRAHDRKRTLAYTVTPTIHRVHPAEGAGADMLTSRPPGTISDSQKYLSGRISRVEIRTDRLISNQMFRKKYLKKQKLFILCPSSGRVSFKQN